MSIETQEQATPSVDAAWEQYKLSVAQLVTVAEEARERIEAAYAAGASVAGAAEYREIPARLSVDLEFNRDPLWDRLHAAFVAGWKDARHDA